VLLEQVFRQASAFDLIHFHVDYLHFKELLGGWSGRLPAHWQRLRFKLFERGQQREFVFENKPPS